jgi:hypothetical protein
VAQRIEEFEVVVAPGTPPSVPLIQGFIFTQGIVTGVDVVFPHGHHALTGIQIWFSDKQVIPITPGDWAIGNFRTQFYQLDNYPTGESWQAQAYNTDVLQHTFHCYFYVDELTGDGGAPPDVILLPFLGSSLT